MTAKWRKVLLCVMAIVLPLLVLNIRGPANTLQTIQLNGNKLNRQKTQFSFANGDQLSSREIQFMSANGNATSGATYRKLNYTEHLRAAYSPTKGHINPHNFKLVMDEPMACMDPGTEMPKKVLLLVLVASIHRNSKRRQAIRETWGSPKELGGHSVVTLFLLASSEDKNLQEIVLEESAEHHDLLMEDFRDTYRDLTLKTLMAMKWANTHCPQASFVMKTDDDMFVSYQNLLDYVASLDMPNTNLAFGLVIAGEAPIRTPGSKWYMPKAFFPGDVYPPWLSGGGFVLSGDIPGRIYVTSLDTTYLPFEDVYVGMCLEKLKITPIMNRLFSNLHIVYSYCRFRYVITAHMYSPSQLRVMWKELLVQKPCWPWT